MKPANTKLSINVCSLLANKWVKISRFFNLGVSIIFKSSGVKNCFIFKMHYFMSKCKVNDWHSKNKKTRCLFVIICMTGLSTGVNGMSPLVVVCENFLRYKIQRLLGALSNSTLFYPPPVAGEGFFPRGWSPSGVTLFCGRKKTSGQFFGTFKITFRASWGCASKFFNDVKDATKI